MRKNRYRRRLFDPVAVPKICCSLSLRQILTAATRSPSFIRHRRRSPLRSCCRYRIALRKCNLLALCDGCHSLLLAYSATGSARKRPHLSTPPNIQLSEF